MNHHSKRSHDRDNALLSCISMFLLCLVISILFVSSVMTAHVITAENEVSDQEQEMTEAVEDAYAILTDNGDLIFFRSSNNYSNGVNQTITVGGSSYTGTVYSGVESTSTGYVSDVPWYSNRISIKKVYVLNGHTIRPSVTYGWFYGCENLTSFNQIGFDTSNTTDMMMMFYNCESLTSLNLSNFNTSNVTDMSGMFGGCYNLESLNVSNFNTAKVTNMGSMFENCQCLSSLDVGSFNTSKVTGMGYMFKDCDGLESLDVSNFDTSNVTGMSCMFFNCGGLETLDLSNFNTVKVTNMAEMFYYCSGLKSLNVSSFDTSNVTDMMNMFGYCWNLKSLNLSNFNTTKVKNMYIMFKNCYDLKSLDISGFNTSSVTNMGDMFRNCESLSSVKLGSGFTKWISNAYLPEGTWTNEEKELSKTEAELYNQYPGNATAWSGTWTRGIDSDYTRIYTESRLAESLKVADELKDTLGVSEFDAIIIAKDSDFADALSGSYLAARKNAPILLVNDFNHEEAYEYIHENLSYDGTIYILGGDSAVSSSFEDNILGSYNFKRLAGSSRFMTNLEILNEAGMIESGDIFIVTGGGFADSLSSAAVGLPIMMVDKTLKNSQKKFLQANVKGKIYILGQTASVNTDIENAVKAYGPVTRIGGSSRWKTTRMIAEEFFSYPEYVVLATGEDFADGLIVSSLAYALQSPLLMVASNKTSEAKNYVSANEITKAYIIGSKDFISDEAVRKILMLDDSVVIVEK